MERCGFFDAHLVGNEYDRVYLAEQFASYFASFIGNGIFGNKLNELQVLSMETPAMQIRIQEGQGWINGYWYENMSELHLPIEVADGVLSRIDSVVLRLGIAERNMWIAVKKGTPSYEPIAPEVTRNDDYFELQLATVWIGAGYTNIKQSDITDTRLVTDVCGLVTGVVHQLDTTTIGNQLQAFMDEYMDKTNAAYTGYINKLDADYAEYTNKLDNDYKNYTDSIGNLKNQAAQDKNAYLKDLQALYALCDAAYREFLTYLANLKSDGDDSLESLKSWIESLKLSSSAEINRLIEELRGLISEDIVPQIVLRLTDLETASKYLVEEMPKKAPRPVDSDLAEGLLYYNQDGTTKLVEDRSQLKRFKYSIIIDNGVDGNPAAIEYADDCSGFIEAFAHNMGDWANTDLYRKYFRPCVIAPEDSEPKYFLQQDEMVLKEDGTPARLDGTDGDVMIQVGKLYGKVVSIAKENKLKLSLMNYKEDDSCFCFNEIEGEEKDYIYISAFECSVPDNLDSSFESVQVLEDNFREFHLFKTSFNTSCYGDLYTKGAFLPNNQPLVPEGYLPGYYYLTYTLYQWMFLFLYKTRDAQAVLGTGRLDDELTIYSGGSGGTTGFYTRSPFCCGHPQEERSTGAVKFLGVENFYGNTPDFIAGLFLIENIYGNTFIGASKSPSRYAEFYDTPSISSTLNYDDFDAYENINVNHYPVTNACFYKQMHLLSSGVFFPKFISAESGEESSNTFWCDGLVFGESGGSFIGASAFAYSTGQYVGPFAYMCRFYSQDYDYMCQSVTGRLCRYI